VFLNCVLLGFLAFLVTKERREQAAGEARIPSGIQAPLTEATTPALMVSPAARTTPFRWSQLESSDYRTYVANLRSVGCPEQTLRDIISADVHGVYAAEENTLQQKKVASGPATRLAIEKELASLRHQEASFIASLLGTSLSPNGSGQMSADEIAAVRLERQEPSEAAVTMPLVFQTVDVAGLNLDDGQLQAINSLRQRFLDEVGGSRQDPNDPAYLERWQRSQPSVDEDLRGMIGVNAYQDYELRARSGAGNTAPDPANPSTNN